MMHIRQWLLDQRFDVFRDQIRLRNYRRIRMFLIIGLLFSAIDAIVNLLLSRFSAFPLAPAAVFFYFFVLTVLYCFLLSERTKHITLIFYLMELPLMALAIWMGTFLDPGCSSITIMVFLCVLPLLILDKPWRVAAYIVATALVYAFCCSVAKAPQQFYADMVNLFLFLSMALAITFFTLMERIDSVESVFQYRSRSERDVLTGIYNRGGDKKISLLLREQVPGAFLIIDVDNFKLINDTYGHYAGDSTLVLLAKTIAKNFRASDIIMRLGGDEFIVYAAGLTDAVLCRKKLEELRTDVQSILVPEATTLRLTVSMGCVRNLGLHTDYAEIYEQADRCLYRAKVAGKNRVEIE
ncbi:MAG: GGDEF domain-containing protein [Oscillospiraceae bacterium]|nr:GGDEF domain-containing protein [Oscillospiraceae bacterium]